MKILLGITGSVAATLTPKLAARLMDDGHEVILVATTPSLYFLPLAAEGDRLALPESTTGTPRWLEVYLDKYEWPAGGYHKNDPVRHIEFRSWADLLLIAPLSANTLAKISNGLADNFLSCIARAWPKERPLVLAPAMNTEMWIDPITAKQLQALPERFKDVTVIEPISKELACGDIGCGAMAEIDTVVETVATVSARTRCNHP